MKCTGLTKQYELADGVKVQVACDGEGEPQSLQVTHQQTVFVLPTLLVERLARLVRDVRPFAAQYRDLCADHGYSEHAAGVCLACTPQPMPAPVMVAAKTGGVITQVDGLPGVAS